MTYETRPNTAEPFTTKPCIPRAKSQERAFLSPQTKQPQPQALAALGTGTGTGLAGTGLSFKAVSHTVNPNKPRMNKAIDTKSAHFNEGAVLKRIANKS